MRITRFRVFLLGGASLLLLGPAISLGQPGGFPGGPPGGSPGGPMPGPGGPPGGPGGFQGGGGRRGGGGFRMDPNMIFNMMAKNQDTLSVADYLANPFVQRDPTSKDKVESFMQRNGITNGQLTRDQFTQMFQERMAERQAQRAAQQGADASQTPGAAATDPNADPEAPEVVPEKRPTVYRANNLPTQGLPPWFAQLDNDPKDGQVGLYEWKAAGRSLSEFQTWDLNGDGFITVEEAMHVFKATQGTAVAAGGPQAPGSPSFGPPQQGGPPQGFQGGNNGGGRQRRNRGNWQNRGSGN